MRCSDCFGEMIEDAGIVQCTSCGRILQAIPEAPVKGRWQTLVDKTAVDTSNLPVPLPLLAAGAALLVITSSALLTLSLSGDQPGMDRSGPGGAPTQVAEAGVDSDTGWRSSDIQVEEGTVIVSTIPDNGGFSLVLQPQSGPATIARVSNQGRLAERIEPSIPNAWTLTSALGVDGGNHIVLGQTPDGLFLFRINDEGFPVWGRFEMATRRATLFATSNQVVIASDLPASEELSFIAYSLEGERIWENRLTGVVTGTEVYTATPSGQILVIADVAPGDGSVTTRMVRYDESGRVVLDEDLGLNVAAMDLAQVAVDDKETVFLMSAGDPATLQRLSPRGVELWASQLPGIVQAEPDAARLLVNTDGVTAVSLDGPRLHAVRISTDGLDIETAQHVLGERPTKLFSAKLTGRDRLDLLTQDSENAIRQPLRHLAKSLRSVFADKTRLSDPADLAISATTPSEPADPIGIRGSTRSSVEPDIRRPAITEDRPSAPRETRTPAATLQSITASSPAALPQRRQVQCSFVCMPEATPQAKYPVRKAYDWREGTPLDAITIDAFDAHDGVCLDSGGVAHPGSLPICEPI